MKRNTVKYSFVLFFLLLSAISFGQQKQINIVEMGAKPDGKTYNTNIIQKALDEASASGNGKVIIPAGKFLTGVIHLKSNVELHLAEGALLLGSAKRADYGMKDASALIEANDQHNISITGKGVIDGQGDELIKDIYEMLNAGTLEDSEWKTYNPWHQMRPEERNRPKLLMLLNCDHIQVKGITIMNGLCWVQDYRNCSNLVVDSIKVESNTFWNNDGIDLVDCKNAKVTNSFFNCDDDGICLKSSDRKRCCENIYIANCTVRASASAIKLGTASWGGFKKITIRDITVYDTYRSAVAIECVDGGVLEDIDVRNIKATNTGNAIFVRLGHRNKDSAVSSVRNVYIGNVNVEVPKTKPDKGYSMEGPLVNEPHNVFPSSVTGIPGHPVKNITIENVTITYEGGSERSVACFGLDSLDRVPERMENYPEFSMFGELPAWGLYIRHAENVQLKNIKISYKQDDFRPSCVFDDVKSLQLTEVNIPTAKEFPMVIFKNITNLTLQQLHLPVDNEKGIRTIE